MSCLFDCFNDDNIIQNDDYIPENIFLPTIKKKKKTIKKVDKSTQTDIILKKKKQKNKSLENIGKNSSLSTKQINYSYINEPGSQKV